MNLCFALAQSYYVVASIPVILCCNDDYLKLGHKTSSRTTEIQIYIWIKCEEQIRAFTTTYKQCNI